MDEQYVDEIEAWNDFEELDLLDDEELRTLAKQYIDSISREELISTVQYLRVMRFEHEPL